MKLVREYINEKFIEDTDPIHDLGIGIYCKHNFNDKKDFIEFAMFVIPIILETKEIPKDILEYYIEYSTGAQHAKSININIKYFKKIDDYLEEYISFRNISLKDVSCIIYYWCDILSSHLIKMGFK